MERPARGWDWAHASTVSFQQLVDVSWFGVGHVLCSHYIKKYNRYEKRHKNVPAHCSPAFKLNVGDNIIVGQCRPLSKTVRFNVLSVVSEAAGSKSFSKY